MYAFSLLLSVYTENETLPMRLVDGRSEQTGRFEIEFNGKWGTVCLRPGSIYTEADYRAICRGLGLPYREVFPIFPGTFETAASDVPAWFSISYCNGYEKSVLDCDISPWSGYVCDHSLDLGVICVDHGKCIIFASLHHEVKYDIFSLKNVPLYIL